MMTINKHTYRTTRVKNDKSSLNQISFFISLVSFSYLAYILLYFYDTGFLNYHGIPSDFVEISIENICNFLIIIFAVFGGIIIISLSSILIKDINAYKITLCIGIGTLIIISYYCYKIFANFDLFISNYSNEKFINHLYSSYSTAFIIVVTGAYLNSNGIEGIELTSKAFASVCPFFPVLLTFMACCFVLSTMLCGSYYGTKSWTFLFGESKLTTRTFQIIYCLFIIIGSAMNLKSVVNLSDAFTLFLAVPNLFAVFLLSDIIMKELKRYCRKYSIGVFKNE